jgi:hypothetical protein
MTQHCCEIFQFACGLRRISMLSDTDAACVATGLAVCLIKVAKIATGPKNGTNTDHNTHTKIL